MKLLTLNFLTCARRTCKSSPLSFPLHPCDAELEIADVDFSLDFLRNILPRLEWDAMVALCSELSLPLSATVPAAAELSGAGDEPTQSAKDLHHLLLETNITAGKLVCGNCGHEYAIKEGIANFLLPAHMV
ncbi:Trm112p-domain-containing protein [Aulographum hederae CBS 113979]|uniref:Trm112p-domain-containing protein n=1 Tax=Aulographum hederae CBS 113979 TaxID=1176131 RepID=A0A6G1H3D1_9PEZI|nr:Trm112p-domain-containing protein [Aulographum hederae CBS 113979]